MRELICWLGPVPETMKVYDLGMVPFGFMVWLSLVKRTVEVHGLVEGCVYGCVMG